MREGLNQANIEKKNQILLLFGLLLNKEIALLKNRDISSDCHMA